MIESLVTLAPDAARTSKTALRCHQVLAARRRTRARSRQPRAAAAAAARFVAAGVCLAYLISMAGNLLTIAIL